MNTIEKKSKNRPKNLTYLKKIPQPITFSYKKYSNIRANFMDAITEDLEAENILFNNYDGEVISIDSEWASTNQPICLQLYIPKHNAKIIVLNSDLKIINPSIYNQNVISYRNNHTICNGVFEFAFSQADHSPLMFALQGYYRKKKLIFPKKVLLLFYYSVKDLIHAFGSNVLRNPMLNGNLRRNSIDWIDQNRAISGQITIQSTKFVLFDVYGFLGQSFQNSAKTFGLNLQNKDLMNQYKAKMEDAFFSPNKKTRNLFLRYSLSDAIDLYKLWEKRIEKHNQMLIESFNFTDKYLIKPNVFPSTVGRLISDTFNNFISFQLANQIDNNLYLLALYRIGFLNPRHPKYNENVTVRQKIYSKTLNEHDRVEILNDTALLKKHLNKKTYSFNGQNLASIPYFFTFDKKSFSAYSSLVAGARTVNEKPNTLTLGNTLDADLTSCYGTALKRFVYPIGKPQEYSKPINSKGISLRVFLKRYEKELVPNCFQIVVSGFLSFEQDLILSKLVTKQAMNKNYQSYETEDSGSKAVDTNLILLRRQIENGIVTTEILELIKAIGTNLEKKELYDLEVICALYYPKSLRCKSVKDWVIKCLETPLSLGEPNFWFSLELKDFIGPLIEKRTFFQQEFKKTGNTEYFANQSSIKLMINTLYGCITSTFFDIGNVCVANNITAFARSQVWLMVKALNGQQSITDGSVFCPETVLFHYNDKKYSRLTGLAGLSNPMLYKDQRYLTEGSLAGLNWASLYKDYNCFKGIDVNQLIIDHINKFCEPYNLKLKLGVEIKMDNTSIKSVHWGKAHYGLLTYDSLKKSFSKKRYWIRGHREKTNNKVDPLFTIFSNVLDGQFTIPSDLTYFSGGILKIREWRKNIKLNKNFDLLPGDNKPFSQQTLSFNFNHFHLLSIEEYKKVNNNQNKYQSITNLVDIYNQMVLDAKVIREKAIKKLTNK